MKAGFLHARIGVFLKAAGNGAPDNFAKGVAPGLGEMAVRPTGQWEDATAVCSGGAAAAPRSKVLGFRRINSLSSRIVLAIAGLALLEMAALVIAGYWQARGILFEREASSVLAALLRNAWHLGVAAFALTTGLAVVLFALLRNAVIRPAAQLAIQAHRLGAGDLAARSGLTEATAGSAQIHHLATAFDSMADRLQRAEAEQEQRVGERTQELERAMRELESFSYAISHDLRAPLRSIDGFSRILGEDLGPRLDPNSAQLLQRIRRQAQHMGGLIDDLLTLAQVSRADLERGVIDLSQLAGDCIDVLRRGDPQRAVQVEIQPGLSASADAQLLRVALSQLLDNAWKFTRGIPDARIEVGATQRLQQTVAYVRDNGVGFDMAYVERLFTEFRRLHSARELAGTGIGLAIVQRIVQRHGGQIWAEGHPGKGATFFFTLAGP